MKPKYLIILGISILILIAGFTGLGFYEVTPDAQDYSITIDPSTITAPQS